MPFVKYIWNRHVFVAKHYIHFDTAILHKNQNKLAPKNKNGLAKNI